MHQQASPLRRSPVVVRGSVVCLLRCFTLRFVSLLFSLLLPVTRPLTGRTSVLCENTYSKCLTRALSARVCAVCFFLTFLMCRYVAQTRELMGIGDPPAGKAKALIILDLWKLHREESFRALLRERGYAFVYAGGFFASCC